MLVVVAFPIGAAIWGCTKPLINSINANRASECRSVINDLREHGQTSRYATKSEAFVKVSSCVWVYLERPGHFKAAFYWFPFGPWEETDVESGVTSYAE